MESIYKNYTEDCLDEIIERYKNSLHDLEINDFNNGVSFAYSEILSYLLNQADAFNIKTEMKDKIKNFNSPL